MFLRGAESAGHAEAQLVAVMGEQPEARPARTLMRWLIRCFRDMGGLREDPKFFVIRLLGFSNRRCWRRDANGSARGVFAQPEDIFSLHLSELKGARRGRGTRLGDPRHRTACDIRP